MTSDELITRQAKQIEEQRDRIARFVKMTKKIGSIMFCIGGPLNDNVNQYTDKQLKPFFEIARLIDGMVKDEEYD